MISTGINDPASHSANVDGCALVNGRAIAQLAVVIVSPALDTTPRSQGAGVVPSSSNGSDPATQPDDIHGRALVSRGAVAQLAIAVVSPTLDAAPRSQGASVYRSGGEGSDPAA